MRNCLMEMLVMFKKFSIAVVIMLAASVVFAQSNSQLVAPNGLIYQIAGKDRIRNDEQIVVYTTEYYKAKPASKNGVDVYVVGGKVVVINDRAGAVYQQNKPDPGPIPVEKNG